jgi:flagella basal body P-ring formation protein FlgA
MKTVLFVTLFALASVAHVSASDVAVRAAIVRCATERLGAGAEVSLQGLEIRATATSDPITAVPEPAARVGRLSVFSLTALTSAGPRRIGSAVAVVDASASHVRLRREVRRGDTLTEADVEALRGPVPGVPLRALPGVAAIAGVRASRDLAAGTVLTGSIVAAVPLVKSGQEVSLRARVGGIEARTLGIATQNGRVGDVIRVVNTDSRRTVVGRVTASGEVEVVHGS